MMNGELKRRRCFPFSVLPSSFASLLPTRSPFGVRVMIPRFLVSLAFLLAATGSTSAQVLALVEGELRDACFHNELTMVLKGSITVQQEGRTQSVPRVAQATHSYFERVLDAKGGIAERTARFYHRGEAAIT